MRTIGTDVSLEICKNEGYIMVEFDARKKFNPNTEYCVFRYYPYDIYNENRIDFKLNYSFNDLIYLYEKDKIGLNNCCETDKHVNFSNPNIYDFLNLASDLSMYWGLK